MCEKPIARLVVDAKSLLDDTLQVYAPPPHEGIR